MSGKTLKKKVIIDTDCGGDDAIGLMCALSRPDVEIVAITCCWGNVDVDQGVANIGKLLDLYEADIPLYRGADNPILGDRETVQWGGFGNDGFGDAALPAPSHRPEKQHAVTALIDLLERATPSDDEVWQIITLGPLTNIALAIRLAPAVFSKLGDASRNIPAMVVMGGATEGKGNSALCSEFNFHCDPEAVKIAFAFKGWKTPIWLVSWETTVNCAMPWDWFDKWINRRKLSDGSIRSVNQNRLQGFIEKVFGRLEEFTRPKDDGTKADTGASEATQDVTCVIPDAVAVAVALIDGIVEESFTTFATIELSGRETRGALCIDWYGTQMSMSKKGRWRNCTLIQQCNVKRFLEAMQQIVDTPKNQKK